MVGGFGELKLGREYVNTFIGVQAATDPFGTNGPADSTQLMLALGIVKAATVTNASNMVTYITPVMGGFSANLQTWFGENVSTAANSNDGNGYSLTGQYAGGPIFASIGAQETKYSVTGDYAQQALSLSYDFGMAKVGYTYVHEGVKAVAAGAADLKNDSNLIGVVVPMGAMNLKASYITATNNLAGADKSGQLVGLGVDYSLSKRTKVYGTYGQISNDSGGAAYGSGYVGALKAGGTGSALAVGVFHTF